VDLGPCDVARFPIALNERNGLGCSTCFNQLLRLLQFTCSPREQRDSDKDRCHEASELAELRMRQKIHAKAIESGEETVGGTLADLGRVFSSFRRLGPLGKTDIARIS
jgi:hypothetical protein